MAYQNRNKCYVDLPVSDEDCYVEASPDCTLGMLGTTPRHLAVMDGDTALNSLCSAGYCAAQEILLVCSADCCRHTDTGITISLRSYVHQLSEISLSASIHQRSETLSLFFCQMGQKLVKSKSK